MGRDLSVGNEVVFLRANAPCMKVIGIEGDQAMVSWIDTEGRMHVMELPLWTLVLAPPREGSETGPSEWNQ